MGRRATWTESEVLGQVMKLFHHKGFGHTSVKDVEQATGLHPGSIYKAYGSKENLFAAALGTYSERIVGVRVRRYLDDAEEPLAGIREFFTSTFQNGPEPNPGCLLT